MAYKAAAVCRGTGDLCSDCTVLDQIIFAAVDASDQTGAVNAAINVTVGFEIAYGRALNTAERSAISLVRADIKSQGVSVTVKAARKVGIVLAEHGSNGDILCQLEVLVIGIAAV